MFLDHSFVQYVEITIIADIIIIYNLLIMHAAKLPYLLSEGSFVKYYRE
jgi:hypothetical protein